MKTNEKIALCNELNMNFDEASELFCEESLQSMQMAKENGGLSWMGWVLKAFCTNPYVGAVALTISIVSGGITLYLAFKGTEAPSGITFDKNGVPCYNGRQIDSLKIDSNGNIHCWFKSTSGGETTQTPTK